MKERVHSIFKLQRSVNLYLLARYALDSKAGSRSVVHRIWNITASLYYDLPTFLVLAENLICFVLSLPW